MSIDRGLVVRGADGTSHVQSIELTLALKPKGKGAKTYRDHQLVLYTDNGDHALLVRTVDVSEEEQSVKVHVRVYPKPPTLLLARWHASAFDRSDGAWAQELVASGGAAGDEIPLLDINGEVQAMLEVKGWPFKEKTEQYNNPDLQALVKQVTKVHGAAFAKVSVHLGPVVRDLPVLFFALLARKMAAQPAQATAYFENVLSVATALAPSGTPLDQLLADALVLPSQAHWAYRADQTRSGKDIDQWSSLWAYPSTKGCVAFDCEDGSIALMQLFLVLRDTELIRPSPQLIRLQNLARRYTPWLAINQLKSKSDSSRDGVGGGSYVLHCCLMLLPTVPGTADPVTIESTARCSGPWRAKQSVSEMAANAKAHDMAQARVDTFPHADRDKAHVRAATSVVQAIKMYGELYALFTCSGGQKTAPASHHVLLPKGTNTVKFLREGGDPARGTYVINMLTAKLETICRRELQLVPAPRFPSAPPARSKIPKGIDASILLPAFASEHLRTHEVAVTSDASVYICA